MSEHCPADCSGKKELKDRQTGAGLRSIVKSVLGAELESVGGRLTSGPYDLRSPYTFASIYTMNGIKQMTIDEKSAVAAEMDRKRRGLDALETEIDECPGLCEVNIEQGEFAGRVMKICGVELSHTVESQ